MKSFLFRGEIPSSKSMMNRAQILSSWNSSIEILGHSECDDVVELRNALQYLKNGKKILEAGQGGTTFRFLCFRVSREVGEFEILAHPQLLKRPQSEIQTILTQFGVQVERTQFGLKIISQGWKKPNKPIEASAAISSQFVSGLLLNCWNLSFPLDIQINGDVVSEPYWKMTQNMVMNQGMKIQTNGLQIHIPTQQKIHSNSLRVESDISSLFPLAVTGALWGKAEFLHFPVNSQQADFEFLNIFKSMNIQFELDGSVLKVEKSNARIPFRGSLKKCPDLFPVLAGLCAFCEGESVIDGAAQLVHKESNRIQETAKILNQMGVKNSVLPDGIIIQGHRNGPQLKTDKTWIDPLSDHRLAMLGSIFEIHDPQVHVINPEVVNKSFPEFWNCLRGSFEKN